MNKYVTGATIKRLREERKLTQQELAEKLFVSDKTVSKWETAKGYPDITILEDLAKALGVSVMELMTGDSIRNTNSNSNMTRTKFYVCPICGNIMFSTGEALISCCGIILPPLEAEVCNSSHNIMVEKFEDEYFVTTSHSMTKEHYISFIAVVKDNGAEIVKLYPEGNAEARFKISRTKYVYFYCNRDGLFSCDVRRLLNNKAEK
ncbi:MAG: helix-turn-helix domain-containing protein [Ruminococcus sp.]|nr:helix-turn-helix domain-containing protein [Ruminococcus sp.]